MSNQPQLHWFPQTKFHAPYLGADILLRPNLIHQLQQAIATHRLTLISAPAGSGKTTLVTSWQNQPDESPRVAWLRLDEEDNDIITFLTALTISLRQLEATFGPNLDTLIATLADPEQQIHRVMGVISNNVTESLPTPFVLLLDDLHNITEPVLHHALDYLLDHLPQQMRIVATTRYEPALSLSRLRARGQLAELHLETLRFTPTEVDGLLNEQLRLGLSARELNTLQTYTEGWVAGLRLLALSLGRLANSTERSAFIGRLSPTERYIFDFLADEVFNEQPTNVQQFLLETSILTELTPTWCTAVTERRDAIRLLDDIYRRNLFLTTAQTEMAGEASGEPSFRYHDLFAEFLQQRLKLDYPQEAIQALHRRAAESASAPTQAIHHYLTAQLWDEAIELIVAVGQQQLQLGFIQLPAHWLGTVPADVVEKRPWIQLFAATDQVQKGHMATAQPVLEQLLQIFSTEGDLSGEIFTLVGLGQVYLAQGRIDKGVWVAEQLLQQARTPIEQVGAHLIKIWSSYYQRQWSDVDAAVSQMLDIAMNSGERGAVQMSAQGISPELLFGKVSIDRFEQYCQHNLAHFDSGGGMIEAGTQMMLGGIYMLRGNLAKAQQATARVQAISLQYGGLGWTDVVNGLSQMMIGMAQGKYALIEQIVQTALQGMAQNTAQQRYVGQYLYAWARALWMQDRLAEVQQVYTRLDSPHIPPQNAQLAEIALPRAVIGSLLARSEGRFAAAEELLRTAVSLHHTLRHSILTGHPQLELASLYLAWGRRDEALREIRPLLANLAQRKMPGVILAEGHSMIPLLEFAVQENCQPDFARQILATWHESQQPRAIIVPTTGETLTPREVEVLCLIANGASNRAIAESLVITERTVKSHVTKILAKLNVSSRTEAAVQANKLNLL